MEQSLLLLSLGSKELVKFATFIHSLGRKLCPGGVSTEDAFAGKVGTAQELPVGGPSARAALAGIHLVLSSLDFKITERLPPLLGGNTSQTPRPYP